VPDVVHGPHRAPLETGRTLFDYADDLSVAVPTSCRRTGRCRECVVEVVKGYRNLSGRTAPEAFLRDRFRLACQAVIERGETDVEFRVQRRRLRILGAPAGAPLELAPMVTERDGQVLYGEETIGPSRGRLLGLAVDVGTTTVVIEMVDLRTGASLAVSAFENPQRFGGSDVVSRIAYDAEQPGELRRAIRRVIDRELQRLYADLGVNRLDVYEAVVVGNATMRDLFFGLDVSTIGHLPFRSITELEWRAGLRASTAVVRLAHQLGVLINPRGRIYGAPLIASHVGADTSADLVAVDIEAQQGVTLLIDIGTNTEVVVTDGRRYLATSSPAGPAFEGGAIRHGMPGADGAIESVALQDGRLTYTTIGNALPEGICGTGLIDSLAVLRRAGWMNALGVFADRAKEIAIAPEQGITLTRNDVSLLAQAKGATSMAQRVLLRTLGVHPQDISQVFLAGAFANALDVPNAIAIGLVPPVPEERVRGVGNASVRGAKALLLSRHKRDALERLVPRIEHVELEAEPDFFDLYVDGLHLQPISA